MADSPASPAFWHAAPTSAGIYVITNILTGDEYIGQSLNVSNRWRQHCNHLLHGTHHSRHLQHAWTKYGAMAFAFTILELVSDLDMLTAREQFWMDTRKPIYNVAPMAGSNRGVMATPETRQRLSASHKGKTLPAEQIAKIRATHLTPESRLRKRLAHLGKVPTQETIEKRRAKLKGRITSPDSLKRIQEDMRGKPKSAETRAKIAASVRGFKHTPEAIEKIRAAGIGRVVSDETRAKIGASLRGQKRSPEFIARITEINQRNAARKRAERAAAQQLAPVEQRSLWE